MKAKVVKTENGWEPAFWCPELKKWVVEPGFAKATRKLVQAALDTDLQLCREIESAERQYLSGYDYACGYWN